MLETCIGITIGPIGDLLLSVTKPAGLWGGSYLFSWIARSLCESLLAQGVPYEAFLSPYFETEEDGKTIKQPLPGIGLFPDRILFKAQSGDMERVKSAFEEVRKAIANELTAQDIPVTAGYPSHKQFVQQFFQLYAVQVPMQVDEPPIGKISPFLNAYEMQHPFCQNAYNPLFALLDNNRLKDSFLMRDCDKRHCPVLMPVEKSKNEYKVRDLLNIARASNLPEHAAKSSAMKKYSYFAIVYADGDHMGNLFSHLTEKEDIISLSKACQQFGVKASGQIEAFGGVPVYAGGDDLLFLSPVENVCPPGVSAELMPDHNGKATVFNLLASLKAAFNQTVRRHAGTIHYKADEQPSLSFGMLLLYNKYPLYEALKQAYDLLEEVKHTPGKNAVKVRLLKHSGQVVECLLRTDEEADALGKQVRGMFHTTAVTEAPMPSPAILEAAAAQATDRSPASEPDSEQFLKSVSSQMTMCKELFALALKQQHEQPGMLQNVFDNTFDSGVHKQTANETYIADIQALTEELYRHEQKAEKEAQEAGSGDKIAAHTKAQSPEIRALEQADAIIRIAKFFVETEKEDA